MNRFLILKEIIVNIGVVYYRVLMPTIVDVGVMVDIDVDIVVPPSVTIIMIRTKPTVVPHRGGSNAGYKSRAKPHGACIGSDRVPASIIRLVIKSKTPCHGVAIINSSSPSWVIIPCSINDGSLIDITASVSWCITDINDFRGGTIDIAVGHIVMR